MNRAGRKQCRSQRVYLQSSKCLVAQMTFRKIWRCWKLSNSRRNGRLTRCSGVCKAGELLYNIYDGPVTIIAMCSRFQSTERALVVTVALCVLGYRFVVRREEREVPFRLRDRRAWRHGNNWNRHRIYAEGGSPSVMETGFKLNSAGDDLFTCKHSWCI